jgi:hypothetical protein
MSDDHLIPNTTQVPNSILDLLMPFLHDGEARVLLYLCRRTYGFDRQSDSVSLDQFVNGIRNSAKQLDFGAGISRRSAINALVILKEIGIVEQLEGGQGRSRIPVYHVNRKCEMVQWLHLISQETDSIKEKIVQRLHLIRAKHALVAPINRKPKQFKDSTEKVQNMHLKEKVQNATIKGANEFSEISHQSGTDTPTKPSNTKPRKEKDTPLPPLPEISAEVIPHASPLPMGEGVVLEKPAKRSKPGTRLPEDWAPTEADYTWAKKKGYHTLVNLDDVTEEFCRYWWSLARNNTKLNWSMTWQNRVQDLATRELDRRQKGKPPHPPGQRTYNVGDLDDDGIMIGKV